MRFTLTLVTGLALSMAIAHAQPRQAAPTVTPAELTAAEKALTNRARSVFRAAPARTATERLGVVRAARQGAAAADLGATVVVTPRAPWVADRVWLASELASTDGQINHYWLNAWPDPFAPSGSFEVNIKTQPGKRYLVECSMGLAGASSARGVIYSLSGPVREAIKQDAYTVSPNGGIVSVITPAGVTTPQFIVSFSVDPAAIGPTGLGILFLDRCEVTPFG